MSVDRQTFEQTIRAATTKLLNERTSVGNWEGQLSSSALSTATSVCALTLSCRSMHKVMCDTTDPSSPEPRALARAVSHKSTTTERVSPDHIHRHSKTNASNMALALGGVHWLWQHQNEDGGWGDTIKSHSNVSTTVLCWAVLGLPEWQNEQVAESVNQAERWLTERAGGLSPDKIAAAVVARYGKDRTFSIPILTMCALCGRLGEGAEAWRYVLPLPFELAACPHQLFKWLRLPVVSYALPALIAIGQARHHHRPTLNPFARMIRQLTRKRTLSVLNSVQPPSGGFLEAAPLTGFVVMSLASMNLSDHPVAKRGLSFLASGVRDDGSWPIDTNLATWTTTLAVNALASNQLEHHALERISFTEAASKNLLSTSQHEKPRGLKPAAQKMVKNKVITPDHRDLPTLSNTDATLIIDWLMTQQYRVEHPYAHAAPGGWAWTDLTGGVPDADDTSGALIALHNLIDENKTVEIDQASIRQAASAGCQWLLDLQNRDGGMPTFCRGWGKLPFDRSSQDLAAHALRAWLVWREQLSAQMQHRVDLAIEKTLAYLVRVQRTDGAWTPLWFGNQHSSTEENLTYGTARVMVGLEAYLLQQTNIAELYHLPYDRGVAWLCTTQNNDGGWGGGCEPSSIEETALAVDALCGSVRVLALKPAKLSQLDDVLAAIERGTNWLIEHTNHGTQFDATPIGFYFAKLWYFEKLYPLIFTVGSFNRVRSVLWK